MPISAAEDAKTFKVGGSRVFQAQIEESRRKNPAGTGLTTEEVRRALAPRRARRTRRPGK
jgi:hypothetical protein